MKRIDIKITLLTRGVCFAVAGLAIGFRPAAAQTLPINIMQSLDQQSNVTNHLKFVWNVVERADSPAASPDLVKKATDAAVLDAKRKAAQQGIKDQAYVQSLINKAICQAGHGYQATDNTTSGQCNFVRNDDQTNVQSNLRVDQRNPPGIVTLTTCQFYNGHTGVYAITSNRTRFASGSQDAAGVNQGFVWYAPGEAVSYDDPAPLYVVLTPEDLSLLSGYNPLHMRAATWQLQSTTADQYTLTAQVMTGTMSPFREQVILDRKHGNLPSSITRIDLGHLSGHGWSDTYTVDAFTRQNTMWVPSHVTFVRDYPHILHSERNWSLKSISSSQNAPLTLPTHVYATDYRLMGQEITPDDIQKASLLKDTRVVSYDWPGTLPDTAALTRMQHAQHPEMASHDYVRQALIVASGILFILAAVWMAARGRRIPRSA